MISGVVEAIEYIGDMMRSEEVEKQMMFSLIISKLHIKRREQRIHLDIRYTEI